MWNKLTKLFLCFATLQILGQFVTVDCKPETTKGKAKVVGASLLVGGLGGAALGHILTKSDKPQEIHHHHHMVVDAPPSVPSPVTTNTSSPPPQRTTIIEKGEVLANGCYTQTVKEPDQHDSSRYIETEQLICPQNLPTANAPNFVHLLPVLTIQQPQSNVSAIHMITIPIYIKPAESPETVVNPQTNNTAAVLSSTPTTLASPQLNPPTLDQPSSVVPTLQVVPVVNTPPPQPSIVQPIQPIAIPEAPATVGPPQVIVLSKTTGFYGDDKKKKMNASNVLLTNSFCLLLSMIVITGFF